jgi:hypothetical protein
MKLQQHALLASALLLSSSALIACGSDDSNPPLQQTGGFGGLGSGGAAAGAGGIVGQGGVGAGGVGAGGVGAGGVGAGGVGAGGVGAGGVGSGGVGAGGAGTGGSSGICTTEGTYGILFEVGIKWASTPVLVCPAEGCTGTQQLKLLSTRTVDGTGKVTDNARICSVTIPSFQTIVGVVKVEFPPAAWDSKPVTTTLTSTLVGMGAGATFSSEDNGIVVGAQLANPVTDTWPAFAAITSVDADGDSKPGVTAVSPNPGAPTGIGTNNADKLYIAFRTVAKVTGKNDTCDKSTGTITLKSVEQGIVGCHYPAGGLVPQEGECNDSQKTFLNDGAPKWQVGTGSKLVMLRMPSGATCADVRNAQF